MDLLSRRRRIPLPPLRRLPLRRSRDAQRRLLGGGEAAQVHDLVTAPDPRLIGLGLLAAETVHAVVARHALGARHQPLRLRLLPHLLARHSKKTLEPPLGRSTDGRVDQLLLHLCREAPALKKPASAKLPFFI